MECTHICDIVLSSPKGNIGILGNSIVPVRNLNEGRLQQNQPVTCLVTKKDKFSGDTCHSCIPVLSERGQYSTNSVTRAKANHRFSLLFIEVSVEETCLDMECIFSYYPWKLSSVTRRLFSPVSIFFNFSLLNMYIPFIFISVYNWIKWFMLRGGFPDVY